MITQSVMFRASLSLCNQRPSAAARPATHTNCRQRAGSVHTNSYTRPMLSTTALQDIFAAVRGSTRLRAVSVQGAQGPTDTLRVITTEGQLFDLDINSGTTTVKDIREAAAIKMDLKYDKVRLAYHGRELFELDDNDLFEKQEGDQQVSAMRRPHAQDESGRERSLMVEPAPGPQANELSKKPLTVRTMEGREYRVTVTPGATTAGQIRKAVAVATGEPVQSVRLQYAGQELNAANDSCIMQFKPELFLMFMMKRMQGGNNSAATGRHTVFEGSRTTCRNKATPQQRASASAAQQAKDAAAEAFRPLDQLVKSPAGSKDLDQSTLVVDKAVTAPGARSGKGPAEVQLAKQFRDLLNHPIPGVSAAPDDEDALTWHVRLPGPADTPYASGWFDVELKFDLNFPGSRPSAKFKTSIWHPNIDETTGEVCIDIGDRICSVGCILSALQLLLTHPNPGSPLNHDCAAQMVNAYKLYVDKARQMTLQHATGNAKLSCAG